MSKLDHTKAISFAVEFAAITTIVIDPVSTVQVAILVDTHALGNCRNHILPVGVLVVSADHIAGQILKATLNPFMDC